MSGTIWTKFYWSDWQSEPALRLCSYAARGLWIDMLCIAAAHDPIGYVAVAGRGLSETDIARMTGGSESEVHVLLGDLERNGVFSRDRKGTIYSRRMVRDAKKVAIAKKNGKNGGNPTLSKQREIFTSDNPKVKGWDNPHIPEAIYQEPENKKELSLATLGESRGGSERSVDLFEDPNPSGQAVLDGSASKPKTVRKPPDGFEEFYRAYPRHVGKMDAEKAYRVAVARITPAEILAGAVRYATATIGKDRQYIAHPATWLRAGRWEDDDAKTNVIEILETFSQTDFRGWQDRLAEYRRSGGWIPKWGPKPEESGCRVPQELLANFFRERAA